jgi:mono/diheme cytochrome c family protein
LRTVPIFVSYAALLLCSWSIMQPARSVWDGVYTTQQAERGAATYRQVCGYCHRDNLRGDEGPALVGTAFTARWTDQTVADLFLTIQSTMPEDSPGSLAPAAYTDVVSYLLQSNGMPPGASELPSDLTALGGLRISDKPKP